MDDRSRQRSGRQASVAGDAADRVIESLIKQFDDPYAFVRELIQNSLDAGTTRIDVDMTWRDGVLSIAVRDDGEGMDRATIEGYLLVKFRSTKEQDLTKIGKFGIGFVSLFAMRPETTVVDTGRDGLWHRVTFASDLSYTLLRMEDPFEGTTVTLNLRSSAAEATQTAAKIRDRAERWCRFVQHDIRTSATGMPGGWGTTPISTPFTVDSPVIVRDEGDGVSAVLGIAATPMAGFYNRGLTLLEEPGATYLPGVVFRVDDGRLEHTLTRDNVIRDASFERLLARLTATARGALGDAVHLEAEQAARARDDDRLQRLWSAIVPEAPWSWRVDAPIIPAVGREPLTLRRITGLTGGWLTTAEVVVGRSGEPLAEAVAASGVPVVHGAQDSAHVAFLNGRGVTIVPVDARWQVANATDAPHCDALLAATAELLGTRLVAARLYGRAIECRLGYTAADPFRVDVAGRSSEGPTAVAVDHPLVQSLVALPPRLAAPVLARGLAIDGGAKVPPLADLLMIAQQRAQEAQ